MKILLLGSPNIKDTHYTDVVTVLNIFSDDIISPLNTKEFTGSDEERYDRALELIANTDIVIAECSKPSIGVGFELREAERLEKRIIIIHSSNSRVSGLIKGSKHVETFIEYTSIEELQEKLQQIL